MSGGPNPFPLQSHALPYHPPPLANRGGEGDRRHGCTHPAGYPLTTSKLIQITVYRYFIFDGQPGAPLPARIRGLRAQTPRRPFVGVPSVEDEGVEGAQAPRRRARRKRQDGCGAVAHEGQDRQPPRHVTDGRRDGAVGSQRVGREAGVHARPRAPPAVPNDGARHAAPTAAPGLRTPRARAGPSARAPSRRGRPRQPRRTRAEVHADAPPAAATAAAAAASWRRAGREDGQRP